jgi:predicted nucleotidyltransferase
MLSQPCLVVMDRGKTEIISLSPDQVKILRIVAEWADLFPCIDAVYVFGSVARGEETPHDIDIAIEYSDEVRANVTAAIECYTNVNARSPELEQSLARVISVSVGWTGLASLREGYDEVAWKSIRAGWETGCCMKAKLIWTEPKPPRSTG